MLFCFRASPYGLAAYPGFCRGFFSSLSAEKMAASALPILCRHRPSAAAAFLFQGFALRSCAPTPAFVGAFFHRWALKKWRHRLCRFYAATAPRQPCRCRRCRRSPCRRVAGRRVAGRRLSASSSSLPPGTAELQLGPCGLKGLVVVGEISQPLAYRLGHRSCIFSQLDKPTGA